MDVINLLLISVTTILIVMRIAGQKDKFFKAFAHVYVGGLFGAGFRGDECCLIQAVVLSVIETIAFIISLRKRSG